MKRFLIPVLLLLASPAMAAEPFKLTRPADANKDGVVSPEEEADYVAKGAAQAREIGVAAPKPSANAVQVRTDDEPKGPPSLGSLEGRAVKPTPFEEAKDFEARRKAEEDD